jgi:hypothetical protein
VLAIAACGSQVKPSAETSGASLASSESSSSVTSSTAAPTSTQIAQSPTVASANGDKPNREFLIGKWGTNGDCTLAIELRADGTSDGPFGNWSYGDGVISFSDEPDFKVHVVVIDNQTMESTNDGKTAKMTRCP